MALASFALQSCTWMFVPPDEVPYKPTGWPGGGTWSIVHTTVGMFDRHVVVDLDSVPPEGGAWPSLNFSGVGC
jgi:hypothetical protein